MLPELVTLGTGVEDGRSTAQAVFFLCQWAMNQLHGTSAYSALWRRKAHRASRAILERCQCCVDLGTCGWELVSSTLKWFWHRYFVGVMERWISEHWLVESKVCHGIVHLWIQMGQFGSPEGTASWIGQIGMNYEFMIQKCQVESQTHLKLT